jgi:hypothetical protein
MREYGRIYPTYWTGQTGRAIRSEGREAQVVSLYLLSCPHANWIGLYYLSLPTLMHEVGIDAAGAGRALFSLSKLDFAHYDVISEVVWIPEMAKYQIGERLNENDKKIKGICNDLKPYEKSIFYGHFYDRYRESYHLDKYIKFTGKPKPLRSPFEAPSKPLPRGILPEAEAEAASEADAEADTSRAFAAKSAQAGSLPALFPVDPVEPEKPVRKSKPDEAYEAFCLKFETERGMQYKRNVKGDFVQLADLRARLKLEGKTTPGKWTIAVNNYFSSILNKFTLADLCNRYDVFMTAALDRFGKPVLEESNNGTSRKDTFGGPEFDPENNVG